MKVVTIVEGIVPTENFDKILEEYANVSSSKAPDGLLQSFLMQETKEPGLWRIVTVWESMEKLMKMREETKVPVAISLFQNVGAQPSVKVFEVKKDFAI